MRGGVRAGSGDMVGDGGQQVSCCARVSRANEGICGNRTVFGARSIGGDHAGGRNKPRGGVFARTCAAVPPYTGGAAGASKPQAISLFGRRSLKREWPPSAISPERNVADGEGWPGERTVTGIATTGIVTTEVSTTGESTMGASKTEASTTGASTTGASTTGAV